MTALPDGWSEPRIGEVCEVVSGGTPKVGEDRYWGGDVNWLTPDDLAKTSERFVTGGRRTLTQEGLASCSAKLMPPGSVLFTSRAPIGYVAVSAAEVCTNQGFKSLVPNESLDPVFLFHQMHHLTAAIKMVATGTTFAEVNKKVISGVRLVVPPTLSEQAEIVRILDMQLARLDTVLEAVQAVRDRADQLRRSLLHAAFTGQLTQPDRNRSERPASWFSRSVGDVVNIQNGYAFKSAWFVDEGVALARGMNIAHGSLDWQDRRSITVERALEFERFQLCEDDLLLALDRPIISTGLKWAVVTRADLPCLLLQRVARLRASAPDLLQEFLQQWLQSPQFISALSPGRSIGVPHISTKEISGFEIPLPPVDEQREIIRVLDAQFTRLRDALAVADRVELECGRLRGSLLQAAFTGELTKTWREAHG